MDRGIAALGTSLGVADASGLDLARLVRSGLPVEALDQLVDSGRLLPGEFTLVLSPQALASRRRQGRLSAQESDRLTRLVRILVAAESTFGAAKARAWLRRPNAVLGGEPPLRMSDTDAGAVAVTPLLGRIDHGISA